MVEESAVDEAAAEPQPKKSTGILAWIVVAVLAIGGGFATPFAVQQFTDQKSDSAQTQVANPEEPPVFIEYGEVVSNLNEPKLNRYLRLQITLLVDKSRQSEIAADVEKNKTSLTSWLLTYLADKRMDDIRGATGQNRLRREIQDHFNAVLYPEGYQRIRGVLFEEFNIQ